MTNPIPERIDLIAKLLRDKLVVADELFSNHAGKIAASSTFRGDRN